MPAVWEVGRRKGAEGARFIDYVLWVECLDVVAFYSFKNAFRVGKNGKIF